jgi:calcineurin-like phosphoesterase family protein
MDSVLVQNWNAVVSPDTPIYHLGDLSYGKPAQPIEYYTRQLRGDVTYLAGNHDDAAAGTDTSAVIDYHGFRFLLIHDPADAPPGFDGWILHGHHHNNDLASFPFIDMKNRRVNACTEVIGYVPVPLREICSLITMKQSSRDTDPVLLRNISEKLIRP